MLHAFKKSNKVLCMNSFLYFVYKVPPAINFSQRYIEKKRKLSKENEKSENLDDIKEKTKEKEKIVKHN